MQCKGAHLVLDAEGHEDAIVPPRREAIQAPIAICHIARGLFAARQGTGVAPLAREGVENLRGEHAC